MDNVKSWSGLILGVGKVLLGVSILIAAFLNFTNPAMAVIQFLAKIIFKSALSSVMWFINDGIRNILSSLYYVDRGVKIIADIAAVVLDIIGIGSTITSISQAKGMLALIKDVGFSLGQAAKMAVRYYSGEITINVVTNYTRVRNLVNAGPNTLLGLGQLFSDFTVLGVDTGWWS